MIKIIINILIAVGPYSIGSTGDVRDIIEHTRPYYQSQGMDIQIGKIKKIRDPYNKLVTIKDSKTKFYQYRYYMDSKLRLRGRWMVLLPPAIEPNGRYILGWSEVKCAKTVYGASWVQLVRSNGESALKADGLLLAHEIAHLLNLNTNKISNPCTVMYEAAISCMYAGIPVNFSPKETSIMKSCLKRNP